MRLGHGANVTSAVVLAATFHAPAPPAADGTELTTVVDIGRAAATAQATADEPPPGLSHDDWSQIRRSIQESGYHATPVAKPGQAPALQASNPQQAYRTIFRRDGIEIIPQTSGAPSWRLGLSVTGYGYLGDVRPLADSEPRAEKQRVEYRRGPVTEWYINRPEGLEQGFELDEPAPRRAATLVVALAVEGDLVSTPDGTGVSFSDGSGMTVVSYTGLKAWDSKGLPLRCRLEAEDQAIRLVVDAQGARFPVTVDPTFVHEAQLSGQAEPIGQSSAVFGASVSVSSDTVVIGAPGEHAPEDDTGAAYVFVRSGTTWTVQQRLVASDGAAGDNFGVSVSVFGDTVVVGAWHDINPGGAHAGSAYVFVRSGTTWSEQQKLLASDGTQFSYFGYSVSISADTVVIGAYQATTSPGAAYVFVRSGTTWSEQQKLSASDGTVFDRFGYSVSISGDTVVVGATFDDTPGGTDAGSTYVFVRSGTTWTEEQHLLGSDVVTGDGFGNSVSVSEDTVLVGSYKDDTPGGVDTGSAYVFVRSGTIWTQQQKVQASDGATGDSFGFSVSVFGETIVVGAPSNSCAYVFVRSGTTWAEQQKLEASDGVLGGLGYGVSVSGDTVIGGAPGVVTPGGSNAGAAYIFVRSGTTWSQQQKLLGSDGMVEDNFGSSVSVSGDTAVVGAYLDATPDGVDAGSAYVFVRTGSTWNLQQKLLASDGAPSDKFGTSVSLSGDTLVVGAVHDTSPFTGAAYVFVRSGTTWSEQQKLLHPLGGGQLFGYSVSVSGDTGVVGAPGLAGTGSAHVFVRSGTTWTEQQKLLASDGAEDDRFGYAVSVSGDTVLVGARFDDNPGGPDGGSAYVFVRSGTTWTEQQKLVASDGEPSDRFGTSVSISADTALIGAVWHDTPNGGDAGSAYVFVRSGTTWTEQQRLGASDGAEFDYFGVSVSVYGDTAVVGAFSDDTPSGADAGSAYVFVRSGTTWTEQQKLLAPDGAQDDQFGFAVSIFGDTALVGAPLDDFQGGFNAGSAHVFRVAQSDLSVTKTDGQATAVPGQPLAYTITVLNAGPTMVMGATVTDAVPAALLGATWTCVASAGSTCGAGGSGSINDSVNLLAGGTASYTLTGTLNPAATGTLVNTAIVATPPSFPDPNPANNSATDVDTLAPEADLGIAKTDSADPVSLGDPLSYALTIGNAGPSDATSVTVVDNLPAGVTFVSSIPGPPTCTFGGGAVTCALGPLAAGGSAAVTINTTVNASSGMLVNTATVSGSDPDPDPRNNSGSAATAIGRREGELAHGTRALYDLAAQAGPVADEDIFRISQKPYSSYEVVVDATSGDIGSGAGPSLERIAADGTTILQGSSPMGTGSSRSLRWINTTSGEIEGETIRVRSATCGTDCGPDDVYMIRAYETTYGVPRFNNAGTQVTVLILQNPTNDPISGQAYFRIPSGALVAVEPFSLNPKETLVLNTGTVPGANGVSGAITVAHNGRYGDLAGKTVALEPATGFSFDSPLVPRLR